MTAYVCGLLFVAGIVMEDVREQKISLLKIVAAGLLAIVYQLLAGNMLLYSDFLLYLISSILPGVALLLIAASSREKIGYGDGMAVMVLGLWTGSFFVWITVCLSMLLAGFYGLFCLIRGKKEPMPFIPFLLLGMEVTLLYV